MREDLWRRSAGEGPVEDLRRRSNARGKALPAIARAIVRDV